MDAAVQCVNEVKIRSEEERFEEWIEAQWEKVERGYEYFEEEYEAGRLKGVDEMTFGEITIVCDI
ncbi:hypothetical protein HK097_001278 [Rhizophlyctis rosea]|uniref:Uncharacterized protein n=1 Tax=Rhizophlyctis rosea TaxID=64517 RepID=A0AAD5S4J4_9FUNG|nr:hypothetical protein HK097_001278 [Rhizophlyctis rosea]